LWAKVKVSSTYDRIVAAQDLKPGTLLKPALLRRETRDETPGRDGFAESMDSVAGRTLRRAVRAGEAIRTQWLDAPKDVVRGELVRVEVKSGAARLELEGQVQAPGRSDRWFS
jgi:flagella basal body P-ring formation protein FlgA